MYNSHPEHKSISDRSESITMMKPGCNTSISVTVVIEQSRHEWDFSAYFYLKSWHNGRKTKAAESAYPSAVKETLIPPKNPKMKPVRCMFEQNDILKV